MLIILQPGADALMQLCSQLFEKYVFSDWSFAAYLIIAVIIDTIIGILVASKLRRIQSYPMRKRFCEKVFHYGIGLIVVHILAAHLVDGQPNPVFAHVMPFFKGFMYMLFIGAEALSIDENMGKLGKPFLPKFFRKRMLEFNETGKLPENNISDVTEPQE